MVVTTHGDRVVRRMVEGVSDYFLPRASLSPLVAAYRATGFGFVDYPGASDWGVSLMSRDWFRGLTDEVGGLTEVSHEAHGWDDHQDVYAFLKT
jgi:hypothetical protein